MQHEAEGTTPSPRLHGFDMPDAMNYISARDLRCVFLCMILVAVTSCGHSLHRSTVKDLPADDRSAVSIGQLPGGKSTALFATVTNRLGHASSAGSLHIADDRLFTEIQIVPQSGRTPTVVSASIDTGGAFSLAWPNNRYRGTGPIVLIDAPMSNHPTVWGGSATHTRGYVRSVVFAGYEFRHLSVTVVDGRDSPLMGFNLLSRSRMYIIDVRSGRLLLGPDAKAYADLHENSVRRISPLLSTAAPEPSGQPNDLVRFRTKSDAYEWISVHTPDDLRSLLISEIDDLPSSAFDDGGVAMRVSGLYQDPPRVRATAGRIECAAILDTGSTLPLIVADDTLFMESEGNTEVQLNDLYGIPGTARLAQDDVPLTLGGTDVGSYPLWVIPEFSANSTELPLLNVGLPVLRDMAFGFDFDNNQHLILDPQCSAEHRMVEDMIR